MKTRTSCELTPFFRFLSFLFNREAEFLKGRRVVKYVENLAVVILEFYPYFSHGGKTREL